jgi:hypothetical protein
MKARLRVLILLLASAPFTLGALDLVPPNTWVELVSGSKKSSLVGNPGQGSDYFAWAPVPVQPGGKYTLLAEWDDGEPLLVLFQGHDPRTPAPSSLPYCVAASAPLSVAGARAYRLNVAVDARSPGNACYIVFAGNRPGRRLRVMLKNPGDPETLSTAVVDGRTIGEAFDAPVYATGKL